MAARKLFLNLVEIAVKFRHLLQRIVSQALGEEFIDTTKKGYTMVVRPPQVLGFEAPKNDWDCLITECVCLMAD